MTKKLAQLKEKFNSLDYQKKLFIYSILFTAALVILIVFSFFSPSSLIQKQKGQESKTNEKQKTERKVKKPKDGSLFFSAQDLRVLKGSKFNLDLMLDSGDYGIESFKAKILFDPQMLQVTKVITSKSFSSYPVNKLAKDSFELSGDAGIYKDTKQAVSGNVKLATLAIKTLKAGETEIQIVTDKSAMLSSGRNILGSIKDCQIKIQ